MVAASVVFVAVVAGRGGRPGRQAPARRGTRSPARPRGRAPCFDLRASQQPLQASTAAAPANQHRPAPRVRRRWRLWLVSGWGLMAVSLCPRPRAMLARRSPELAAHCRATLGAPQIAHPAAQGTAAQALAPARTGECQNCRPAARHPARSTAPQHAPRAQTNDWRSGGAATDTRACRRRGRLVSCRHVLRHGRDLGPALAVLANMSSRSSSLSSAVAGRGAWVSAFPHMHAMAHGGAGSCALHRGVGGAPAHRVAGRGSRVAAGRGKEQPSESRPSWPQQSAQGVAATGSLRGGDKHRSRSLARVPPTHAVPRTQHAHAHAQRRRWLALARGGVTPSGGGAVVDADGWAVRPRAAA